MFRGMNTRQIVMDCVCIALCVLTLAAVLILWRRLPDRIVTNFDFSGEHGSYGAKSRIFVLIGIMFLLTGMFSALLRIPAVYRHINMPWTIPWGREPQIVCLTKDFLCVTNLCVTVDNAYLVYASIRGALSSWLVWLPYIVMFAATVWYLVRARKICKG